MLEKETILQSALAFGKTFLAPITAQVDAEGVFPKSAYDALRKEGYMGLLVPKEYGGLGGGNFEHTEVCYALGQHCATTALCYMMHNTAVAGLLAVGSSALKQEFLPKIAKGEVAFALAFSESGSGTHFGEPDILEEALGSDRILKGRKSFVTSAQNAEYYLTYTNSCLQQGAKNIWLVHKDSDNLLHEENVWNGLGMRGNASKPVQYNNVRVSENLRVGDEGEGDAAAGVILMHFVTGLAAVYSGLAKAAYDCVLEHTKTRQYTNKSLLSDVPLVKVHLAEMYVKTQSAMTLAYAAAKSFDQGDADCANKVFASRIHATHCVLDVCMLAMRLGGGRAYSKLLPLERYMRDALAAQVMAPSLDVLKSWLGDAITQ